MSTSIGKYFNGQTLAGRMHESGIRTFTDFLEILKKGARVDMTRGAFLSLDKASRNSAKQVPYFVAACFDRTPSERKNICATVCNLIFLDIDKSEDASPFVRNKGLLDKALYKFNFAAYETASSMQAKPRLRIVIEADGIPKSKYAAAVDYFGGLLELSEITKESRNPTQAMYLPTRFSDTEEGVSLLLTDWNNGSACTVNDIGSLGGKPPTGSKGKVKYYMESNDEVNSIEHLSPQSGTSLEDARELLSDIDPDCGYQDWLRVAMALKHEFSPNQNNEAYELFDEWSSEGTKYVDRDETRATWESLKQTPIGRNPVTIATLFKMAKESREAPSLESVPELPAAKPFPIHCLPPAIATMALAIANTERTPLCLAGCCTLGILSGSIGAGLRIRSGPERFTRGNLFILASAESGSGKSETFRHAAQPFLLFEKEQLECWTESTLPGLGAEKDILEAEIKKLKGMAGGAKGASERDEISTRLAAKKSDFAKVESRMSAPVLSVEDVTTERLAVLLSKNKETLMSMSPDAGAIVNNMLGRYNKTDRTDESIYLKAFSGDYCRTDRQSREPVLLQSPCLNALWLTQPDKVETLLGEQSLTDGGLLPRFLICHTNAQPLPINKDATGILPETSLAYRKVIRGLLETYRLAIEGWTIQPSPEALTEMNAYYDEIVERRLSELRDVTTFAARWAEQAWRIAVCLHAGLWRAQAHEQALEIQTARDAIKLATWFAEQQLEILSAGRGRAAAALRDKVLSLVVDSPNGIRASDVYRARIKPGASEARALLKAMEAAGVLTGRDEQPESGGHVTRIYTKAR